MKSKRIMLHVRKSGLRPACSQRLAFGQAPAGPSKITLDQAIQLAIEHNHSLLAARTTIVQNQALEVQANVRPNPTLFTDWEYLPLVRYRNRDCQLPP